MSLFADVTGWNVTCFAVGGFAVFPGARIRGDLCWWLRCPGFAGIGLAGALLGAQGREGTGLVRGSGGYALVVGAHLVAGGWRGRRPGPHAPLRGGLGGGAGASRGGNAWDTTGNYS